MYLGIDIGSTSLKAAAFDARRGRLLAQTEQRLPLEVDETGKREQDPTALVQAICAAAGSLRHQVADRWNNVKGIGLAAQGGSTILVNRETGAPATPMFLWNDTRAFGHFHKIAAKFPPRWWRAFSLRDEPGMGLARAQWMREQWPKLFKNNPLCVGAGEHVYFALTGQWRQDACHALQSGCYDAVKNRITTRPMTHCGLPADFFAPLRQGHETHPLTVEAATLLQLPAGIPIAGPYNDHEAGYLSVLHASRLPLECSLGTAWVGNFVLPPAFKGGSPFQLCIPAPTGKGQQVIMPLMTGNVTLDWALSTFVHADQQTALGRADGIFSDAMLPSPGLVALPWLNRPNALRPAQTGCGAFFGVSPATTPADLFRAVITAMTFEFARVLDPVIKSGAVDSLVLCGGAAKNLHIRSLFAALFAPMPIHQVIETELMGTRGCLYAFDPQIARAHTAPVHCDGRVNAEELAAARALYLETFERLCGHVPAGKPYSLKATKRK
ncbi:MAG: FGGY-family carbohydrate kinase [Verrucomicrobia bacterium]|nr:FGGY-family carbohydrate kinase [Verrucomicrobiota bacterium]